ncbi:MAG: PKD domain-containing protein [Bacteroidota bacterium]
MNIRHYTLLISWLFIGLFWTQTAHSAHVIGGEISYECLGKTPDGANGRYLITMRIFRDCQGGGADFDSNPGSPFEATVTIYSELSTLPLVFSLDAPTITIIDPTSDPCFDIPDNICVEEGIYTFEAELPVIDGSYHIVYQRCCRNQAVSNILDSGLTGATYTTEMTAEAQQLCSSSPALDKLPPIAVCVDLPLAFDLSANDPDGDSLVYELCAPLVGGGTDTEFFNSPDGVAPNPDLPPPYDSVSFATNIYSSTNPLGRIANARIDSRTGLLTASPRIMGQFVVAICIREYRDGELLSLTRRDFHLNVTSCTPKVIAQIAADSIVQENDAFFLKACGLENIELINESIERDNIMNYSWEVDIQGDTQRFDSWNLILDLPELGDYNARLILNPNTSCGDTANIFIQARPEVNADFAMLYDTCFGSEIVFQDQSEAASMQLKSWEWDFGDGTSSINQNPTHTYDSINVYNVKLSVTDINECSDTIMKELPYFPIPPLLEVSTSEFLLCVPQEVQFTTLSEPIDERYDIEWDFGDGKTSSELQPTYRYETSGIFDVSLSVIAPTGCRAFSAFDELITARESPDVQFTFTPEVPSLQERELTITNTTTDADSYEWLLNGRLESELSDPTITLADTGLFELQLIALNQNGCTDTLIQFIDIPPEVFAYLPNAFSPNGDGVNDEFRITGILTELRDYQLQIWDRWGSLLFESRELEMPWDGKTLSNVDAPTGVYIYSVSFIGARNQLYEYSGSLTLIR